MAPLVARALRHALGDTLDLDELRDSILAGRRILWVVHRGDRIASCLILEFVRHASGRMALRIEILSGAHFWEWAEQVQQLLVDLAELTGADRLEAVTRPGLVRWSERLGWRPRATVVELPVGAR